MSYRQGQAGHLDYRPIDSARAQRIHDLAVPLGLGSLALGASLAGVVVYLALSWVQKMPLVAMTAGTHGSVALIAMYCGVITMSMRRVVSTGQLELGSAHAIRRNLLVMWTMSLVMACLGWFAFAVGISMAHVPVGASAILVDLPVSGVLVAYTGTVAVLARRLLRGA